MPSTGVSSEWISRCIRLRTREKALGDWAGTEWKQQGQLCRHFRGCPHPAPTLALRTLTLITHPDSTCPPELDSVLCRPLLGSSEFRVRVTPMELKAAASAKLTAPWHPPETVKAWSDWSCSVTVGDGGTPGFRNKRVRDMIE